MGKEEIKWMNLEVRENANNDCDGCLFYNGIPDDYDDGVCNGVQRLTGVSCINLIFVKPESWVQLESFSDVFEGDTIKWQRAGLRKGDTYTVLSTAYDETLNTEGALIQNVTSKRIMWIVGNDNAECYLRKVVDH